LLEYLLNNCDQNVTHKFILIIRFDEKDSVSGVQQLKSSVQKGIRAKLLELYPYLESHIDVIIPKKDAFRIVKWWVAVCAKFIGNLTIFLFSSATII